MSYAGPYSYVDMSVVAATLSYAFTPIPHLRVDHLTLFYRASSASDFTEVDSDDYALTAVGTTVTAVISSTPTDWATSGVVRLVRATPVGSTGRLVDFQDGSLSSDDLDTSALQNLYIAEEVWDDTQDSLGKVSGNPAEWNAENLPITNLAAPTETSDAARKADVDAVALSTGNLPALEASSTRYWLVSGLDGAWGTSSTATAQSLLGLGTAAFVPTGTDAGDVPTITEADARYLVESENLNDLPNKGTARTNLGLGDAAELTAGVAIGNLVQMIDSSGSKLPAVNGSLLTNLPTVTNRVMGFGEYQFDSMPHTIVAHATDYTDLPLQAVTGAIDSDGVAIHTGNATFELDAASRYIVEIYVIVKNADSSDRTFNIRLNDDTAGATSPIWSSPDINCELTGGNQSFRRVTVINTGGSVNLYSWKAKCHTSSGTNVTLIAGQFLITKIS